ncbi:MAG: B12-binding domain-containing radical SAM protein [Anaerolineae bacterium]
MSTERRLVVLYHPEIFDGFYRFPISLLALAAVLEESPYEVIIVDANIEPEPLKRLETLAPAALCIGMTTMPGRQTMNAYRDSQYLKARFPDLPIVWGGYFASMYPDVCLTSRAVDILVRGQGEITFTELLGRLAGSACDPDLTDLAGISYCNGDRIVHNPEQPMVKAYDFPPFPFWKLPVQRYINRMWLGDRTTFYVSSIGCTYNCSFCAIPVTLGERRWTGFPARRVLQDIDYLLKTCHIDGLYFGDTNFFVDERRVRDITQGLIERGSPINWWAEGVIGQLLRYDDSTWEMLRESRCTGLFVGVESGSDEVLAMTVDNKTSREQAREFARKCRRHGLFPEFSFVLGYPPEPEKDITASVDFMYELKAIHPFSHLIPHIFTPLAGTDDYALAQQYGFAHPRTMEEWIEGPWQEFSNMHGTRTPWLKPWTRRYLRHLDKVIWYKNLLETPNRPLVPVRPIGKELIKCFTRLRWRFRFFWFPYELAVFRRVARFV